MNCPSGGGNSEVVGFLNRYVRAYQIKREGVALFQSARYRIDKFSTMNKEGAVGLLIYSTMST